MENRDPASTNKITIAELYSQVGSQRGTLSFEDRQRDAQLTLRETETHIKGWEQYYELRNGWSNILKWLVGTMVFFQISLTIAIGRNWLNFSTFSAFPYLIIGENFAQIVGMAYIVVNFLFPKGLLPNHKKGGNNIFRPE